jgi:hypothetical protein
MDEDGGGPRRFAAPFAFVVNIPQGGSTTSRVVNVRFH